MKETYELGHIDTNNNISYFRYDNDSKTLSLYVFESIHTSLVLLSGLIFIKLSDHSQWKINPAGKRNVKKTKNSRNSGGQITK